MLIEARNISKRYTTGFTDRTGTLALNDVSLNINQGEILGLFGESGSGKTTLGHILAGMLKPSKGQVFLKDKPVSYPYKGQTRKSVQVVFQHPELSFNPCLTIRKSLDETYKHHIGKNYLDRMLEDMEMFGIYEEHLDRYPYELSGGEVQRATLMRVLAVRPEILVLDEVTNMLDIISQAQIMKLLTEYQRKFNVSYLCITHNYQLCRSFCSRIVYLNHGEITKEEIV